ncbi:MAG: hypothetical protein CVT72_01790 [Alphaproteobacteria bacterium HGW-Alphaproteobacteria-11]|nr:MAG: hypothetical protein CVT72_01790 [Alphaproteobacteria bacterium HGW-Alphaproteobacteria-11]
MFDFPGMTEEDKARDRFLGRFGTTMLVVFALWNIGLGIGDLRWIDLRALELASGIFDRPWAAIEGKYGTDLAEFAYLAKIRIVTFVVLELCFVMMFLLLSGFWQSALTPAPTFKDETQSLIDGGDLRSVRGHTHWEWFLLTHPANILATGGRNLPKVGVRSAYIVIIIVFVLMSSLLLATPIWTPDFTSRGRHTPEMDILLLVLAAVVLVWLAPVFLVTALRFLLAGNDREMHSPH